jgi:hypothetical protein
VWMVVIVDDETQSSSRRFKDAPPIDPKFGRSVPFYSKDNGSSPNFGMAHGARPGEGSQIGENGSVRSFGEGTERSGSPYTLRIG